MKDLPYIEHKITYPTHMQHWSTWCVPVQPDSTSLYGYTIAVHKWHKLKAREGSPWGHWGTDRHRVSELLLYYMSPQGSYLQAWNIAEHLHIIAVWRLTVCFIMLYLITCCSIALHIALSFLPLSQRCEQCGSTNRNKTWTNCESSPPSQSCVFHCPACRSHLISSETKENEAFRNIKVLSNLAIADSTTLETRMARQNIRELHRCCESHPWSHQ